MDNEKLGQLVAALLEKTTNGELSWKKTSNRDIYLTSFPKYSVTIEGPDYSPKFRLHNEDGETIEQLVLVTAPKDTIEQMTELFRLARRQSLGAEKAVDELLEILGQPREKKQDA